MNLKEHSRNFEQLKALIADNRKILRIAVCGCFNSGKTSLLNRLFGLNLPVKTVTATGVITKIHSGSRLQVETANGFLRTISKKDLNDLIVVKKNSKEIVQGEVVTAWVGCQSELLPDSEVEFWDTPGLEDDKILDDMTERSVEQCDVVIFVMDAGRLLSDSDKYFLARKLKESVGSNIIAVINKMDTLSPQDAQEIFDEARYMLANFGNKYCGLGPVFTSANLKSPQIDDLKKRLMRIVLDKKRLYDCLSVAHEAKIKNFSNEWLSMLNEDLQTMEATLNFDQRQVEEFHHFDRKHDWTKKNLAQNLDFPIRKLDDIDFWRKTLERVKAEENWEKNYVKLSAKVMKDALEKIFADMQDVLREYLSALDYPSCTFLQYEKINTDKVWTKMNWGENFDDDHFGGMLSGAATGAALGSVVPIIGTSFGMVTGFFVGALRDGSKDEEAKKIFQDNCTRNTIRAYLNGPAKVAKDLAKDFKQNLFVTMDQDFTDRINRQLNPNVSAQKVFWKRRSVLKDYIDAIKNC